MSATLFFAILAFLVLALWVGFLFEKMKGLRDASRDAWKDLTAVLDRRLHLLALLGEGTAAHREMERPDSIFTVLPSLGSPDPFSNAQKPLG